MSNEQFRAQYRASNLDEYHAQREQITPEQEAEIADKVAARIHLPVAQAELRNFIAKTAERLGVSEDRLQGE